MSRPLYPAFPEPEACLICETAPNPRHKPKSLPRLQDCSEEELASVRLVLRRLTALRIRNEQDAEDLVQETLLTVTAKFPEGDLRKGVLVWSMGILRKKVGNYYRKIQRYTALDDRSIRPSRGTRADWAAYSPESGLMHRELRLLVQRIVAGFPELERQALELCLAGLETQEIARRLHPERYQNIVNRIYRGRRRLAKELAKYGYAAASQE